jgi:hypothetical protein
LIGAPSFNRSKQRPTHEKPKQNYKIETMS